MPVSRIDAFKDEFAAVFGKVALTNPEVTSAARPCLGVLHGASAPSIRIRGYGPLHVMSASVFQALRTRFRSVNPSRPNDIYLQNYRDFTIATPEWSSLEARALDAVGPNVYWPEGNPLACSGLLISGPGSPGDIPWPLPNPDLDTNALMAIVLPSRYRGGGITFGTAYGPNVINMDAFSDAVSYVGFKLDLPQGSTPIASGYRLAFIYMVPYAGEEEAEIDPVDAVKRLCQRWKRRTTYRPTHLIYPLSRTVDLDPNQTNEDRQMDITQDERVVQAVCAAAIPLRFEVYQAQLVFREVGFTRQRTYNAYRNARPAEISVPMYECTDIESSLELSEEVRMDENGEMGDWEELDDDLINDAAMVSESVWDIMDQAILHPPRLVEGTSEAVGTEPLYMVERVSKRYVLIMIPPERRPRRPVYDPWLNALTLRLGFAIPPTALAHPY